MTTPPIVKKKLITARALRISGLAVMALVAVYFIAQAGHASHENWEDQTPLPELHAMVKRNPNDEEAAYKLAHRMVEENDPKGAFVIMQRLVQQHPDSVTYWDGYARCAATNNNLLEALRGYRRLLELSPQDPLAHAFIGQIDIKAGLTTDGLAEIETARKIDPKVGLNVVVYVQGLEQKGRIQEAYDAIVKSISIAPVQDGLYPLLGRLAPQVGQVRSATTLMWRRIGLSPMYHVGLVRCALVRLMLSQSHARATLAEAEDIAHDAQPGRTADFSAALGEVYLAENNLAAARKVLLDGLTIDKGDPACLRALIALAEKQGKPAEAAAWRAKLPAENKESPRIAALRQAASAHPEDAAALLNLAQALEQDTEYGPAAEVCLQILARTPGDAAATPLLAECRSKAIEKLAHSPEVTEGKY